MEEGDIDAPMMPPPATPATPATPVTPTEEISPASNVRMSGRVRKKSSKLADFVESADQPLPYQSQPESTPSSSSSKARVSQNKDDETVVHFSEEEFARIPNVESMDLDNEKAEGDDQHGDGEEDEDDGGLVIDDSKKQPTSKKGSKRKGTPKGHQQPRYPAYVLFVKAMVEREGSVAEGLSEASRRLAGKWRNLSRTEKDLWRKRAL